MPCTTLTAMWGGRRAISSIADIRNQGVVLGKYGGIDSRNHGWGRSMAFAGRQIAQSRYASYSSRDIVGDRWAKFAEWARSELGIRDMRDVTEATVRQYGQFLSQSDYAISTAQNLISAVNTVMAYAREGAWQSVSPRELIGQARSQVRATAPVTLDRGRYEAAREALRAAGLDRAAAALGLAREFGVRIEEAVKADLARWAREADRHGAINVQEGAKGGRRAPRWVPVRPQGREALKTALRASPAASRNLIAPTESYRQIRDGEIRAGRAILHDHGLRGYHDARAAYACERYQELTGRPAPAVAGQRVADRGADRAARQTIGAELGHGRIDVLAAYVGSAR